MLNAKQISPNISGDKIKNWLAITNAIAEQRTKSGIPTPAISAQNARDVYGKIVKSVMAFANPGASEHNAAFNAIKGTMSERSALDTLENLGRGLLANASKVRNNAKKSGMSDSEASAFAVNSIAGQSTFDHFLNLSITAEQLMEQKTFLGAFTELGDAYALPVEAGANGTDKSRFRAPITQSVGSPKIVNGAINPARQSLLYPDNNSGQINLTNEFKDAVTIAENFAITADQQSNFLGYASAVAPALAGYVLQNLLTESVNENVLRLAEILFVDGLDAFGNYTPNVGGSYGLLSPAVQLLLADAASASPSLAQASDWTANPTKLIQTINNFNVVLGTPNAQIPVNSANAAKFYADIVRLLNLYATANVATSATRLVLYVPTYFFGNLTQYLGNLYTKQLGEAVRQATGGVVENIEIRASGLLGYRAANSYGQSQLNYFALVAHGAPTGKKGVILPGVTATPIVSSNVVSQEEMWFTSRYIFGGPMLLHTSQVFLMQFNH